MPNLLIYTLGPVQDFIAAAKRCRDLWFGSWLLSELSKAAAASVADQCGRKALIFPAPATTEDLAPASRMSVANKIVAELPDGSEPKFIADLITAGVRTRLRELRDEAFDNKPSFDHILAEQQIEDLIDTQWVSVVVDPQKGYAAARRRGEQLLASAKNTRIWGQPPWQTGSQPKSSLDGLRESVLNETIYRGQTQHRTAFKIGEAERLCGIGLLKRHGKRRDKLDPIDSDEDHLFFSTPHLAALPVITRINSLVPAQKDQAQLLWNGYLDALRAHSADLGKTVHPQWRDPFLGGHDGQLLFESRVIERLAHLAPEQQRLALSDALPCLHRFLTAIGVATPLPYIAILVADGDHIGKAIDQIKTVEDHRKLSIDLDGFARAARSTVSRHSGQLIYAGGDDVLAFVPLHRAIDCARALADDFQARLQVHGDGITSPTLSVGVAICHFMNPMTKSLEAARKAEKLAKRARNSLALILHKRSGPPVESTGRWDNNIYEVLQSLIALHLGDAIPDKLAHDLQELTRLRHRSLPEHQNRLDKIMTAEFHQILARKRAHRGTEELDKMTLEHLQPQDPELAPRLLITKILAEAMQTATAPMENAP